MVAPVVVLAPATGLFKSPPDDATSCFDDLFLRDEGRLRRVKYSITPPYTKLAITMMTPMYASSPLPNRRSKKSITLTTNQLNEGTKGRKKGQVKLVKQRQPATGNGLSSSRASSCGRCGSSHVGFCGWCSRFKERGGRGERERAGEGERRKEVPLFIPVYPVFVQTVSGAQNMRANNVIKAQTNPGVLAFRSGGFSARVVSRFLYKNLKPVGGVMFNRIPKLLKKTQTGWKKTKRG